MMNIKNHKIMTELQIVKDRIIFKSFLNLSVTTFQITKLSGQILHLLRLEFRSQIIQFNVVQQQCPILSNSLDCNRSHCRYYSKDRFECIRTNAKRNIEEQVKFLELFQI